MLIEPYVDRTGPMRFGLDRIQYGSRLNQSDKMDLSEASTLATKDANSMDSKHLERSNNILLGSPLNYLTCRQSPTVRGTIGWSACRVGSAMSSIVGCQGYYLLVDPICLLYHVANRLLSGALFADRFDTFVLSCR
ncbi:hypothetical protein GW17_00001557 [Ensete ventricosum]|nr:hypothetical protein GW17_00001557 [Ensete ventricosum]